MCDARYCGHVPEAQRKGAIAILAPKGTKGMKRLNPSTQRPSALFRKRAGSYSGERAECNPRGIIGRDPGMVRVDWNMRAVNEKSSSCQNKTTAEQQLPEQDNGMNGPFRSRPFCVPRPILSRNPWKRGEQ